MEGKGAKKLGRWTANYDGPYRTSGRAGTRYRNRHNIFTPGMYASYKLYRRMDKGPMMQAPTEAKIADRRREYACACRDRGYQAGTDWFTPSGRNHQIKQAASKPAIIDKIKIKPETCL